MSIGRIKHIVGVRTPMQDQSSNKVAGIGHWRGMHSSERYCKYSVTLYFYNAWPEYFTFSFKMSGQISRSHSDN